MLASFMRRWFIFLGLVGIGVLAVAFWRAGGSSTTRAPFADRLPADTVLYLATRDAADLVSRLRALPMEQTEWNALAHELGIEQWTQQLSELRGTVGLVAWPGPSGLDWVLLFHVGPAAFFVGTGEKEGWYYTTDGDRVVAAMTRAVLGRFQAAPQRPLEIARGEGEVPFYVAPLAFPHEAWSLWCARWRDFTAISGVVEVRDRLRVRAMASYAGIAYRHIVEYALQAPRQAVAPPEAVAWTAQIESFPRLWADLVRTLPAEDVRRIEHQVELFAREGRHPVRELLPRLGPTWSVALLRSGSLVASVQTTTVPELPAVLHRSVGEYARTLRHRRRSALVDLEGGELCMGEWRMSLRDRGDRLDVGEAPPLFGEGVHHLGTVLDFAALRTFIEESQLKPLAEMLFGSVASACSALDHMRGLSRGEIWTRYTPEGAWIEVELTVGGNLLARGR